MRRRWPLIVLILAPLLALWPGLTGLAVGPFDAIRAMPPWNGPKPAQPWDVLMADSVLQSHVWRTLVLDAWGKGQLPLWNPYEFAGTPLLANSQSGGFYPPHIVLGLLHVPAGVAGFLLAWFHLALAGLGTYALVRRLGGSGAGGLTGGLAFGLSPFLLGWTPLSSVLATVAWIPLALACVVDAKDRRSCLALAACVGMMLLAGHLQFAAYGIGAIPLLGLGHPLSFFRGSSVSNTETDRREENEREGPPRDALRRAPGGGGGEQDRPVWRAGASVLVALLLGFALAAPQLLPVLSYSKESHRRNVPTEEGYQSYVASALKPYELANLGHPMALGNPREPVEVAGTTVAAYWPALLNRNFAESAVSLGAVVFALLFAVPWRRRETWPLAALGGLALLIALGTPLDRLLYFVVPGWSSTGSPGRIEVLFVLAACALAGLAVDRLGEKKVGLAAGGGLVVALLMAFVLPGLATVEGAAAALRGLATTGVLPSLLLSTLLAGATIFGAKRTPWAVPAGLVLVALLTHATGLVPFGKPLEKIPGDPNARIAVVNDDWQIAVAPQALMPPNLAALSGLHELSGYDSLTSRDAVEMLQAANGGINPAPGANGNMMFVKPSLDPKALAECGVTEVWSRKPLPQLRTPEQREGYVVYRLDGPGRVTNGKVEDGYDRQYVEGEAMIRDRLTTGWQVQSGTARAEPFSDGLASWRKVKFASDVRGELAYDAPGVWDGVILGDVAWIALLGLSLACWRADRRTRSV